LVLFFRKEHPCLSWAVPMKRLLLAIILLPVALIALILIAANTSPGQRLIESETKNLTSGTVVLTGLSGRFPDALRLAHGELRDAHGPWLTIDDLALHWSPLALIGGSADIQLLQARSVAMPRLPAPAATQAKASQSGFSLPVRINIHALHIARLDLGAPVALKPAIVKIDGAAAIVSLRQGQASIAIDRLDSPGTYRLEAALTPAAINAHLTAAEPQGGLIGGLANLPGLGALTLTAAIEGPRGAEKTTLTLTAGQLRADAHGTIDLAQTSAHLDVDATAPAMAPRADLSWGGVTLRAHVQGPFTAPDISAHATLQDFKGGGASIAALTADATGNRGALDAHTVLSGLIIPGAKPDLFAGAPIDVSLHADLGKPRIPIRFALKHPVVSADGTATVGGDLAATIHTTVPDLAPLAALGHAELRGRTEATASMSTHGDTTDIKLDGTADFTGGQAPVPALLGHTTYGVTASLAGDTIAISRAVVDGQAAHATVTGTDTNTGLDLAYTFSLANLAAVSPQARGALQASGKIQGPQTGLAVTADIRGDIGTDTIRKGPIDVSLSAQNLPSSPSGTITAQGSFAGAPVTLDATLGVQADGSLHAVLNRAAWKSFSAGADLIFAKGAMFPAGTLDARMARLADLAPVLHQPLQGAFTASIATTATATPNARIDVRATNLAAAGSAVARLSLSGTVRDPAGKNPDLALVLAAGGVSAPQITGEARITANGRLDALLLRAASTAQAGGMPATLAAQALLDMPGNRLTLQTLGATYRNQNLRLAAPARITYGASTGIDRLRLAIGAATLDVAGKISPSLDLTASLRNVTPDLAKAFDPGLNAGGILAADAHVLGRMEAPRGNIRVQASNLRVRSGPGASLPPGQFSATVSLDGDTAQLDAHASAGAKLHVSASGTAPIRSGGALAIHAAGGIDLSLLNPVLNAGGKRAAGELSLNATIGGTAAAPSINGAVTLAGGEIQDFVQGLRIRTIAATITADGDTATIQKFSAQAGPGSLSLTGSVGLLAPGIPINLHFTASNARPLSSDLLTADLDADLSIHGQATGDMQAAGKIFVRKADINIPENLPPSVAVLNVRFPGYKPPPAAPPAPPRNVHLDLEIDAPSNVFVRGHGLDSELGGKLTIGGTAAAPDISGGFEMRRGDISVAGTTLTFSKGEVGFDGSSVTGKIDPTLNFIADSISGGVTATLTVGGYADAPKITLSSVPDLPQDEVLAHLLFGTSVKDLSTVQIAEIAAALAQLSGVTGSGSDPLGAVRKGLGLDRLSVGSAAGTGNGATLEAGRYVARGVFIGAKQNTSGGTAAEVQIDLTKRLKLTSQLATGGGSVQGATPDNDPGSTIGLSYGFDY
jgi:translocation and assembly module TamB